MKKIIYILSSIVLLAGTVITVQSCMQTEETGNEIVTEVDKFIASPEYQAFLANERKNNYEKFQIIMQLPEDQRNKFMELNQKILETECYEGKLALMKTMSEIVGYDIPEYLQNTIEARYKMFEGKDFSPEEILRAELKYKYRYIANIKTRVEEKEEDFVGYHKCENDCSMQYGIDMLDCSRNYKPGTQDLWECQANASAKSNQCIYRCKKKYLENDPLYQ